MGSTEIIIEDPNESESPELPEIECVIGPEPDIGMEIEQVREKDVKFEMEMKCFGEDGDDDEH